MRWYLVFCLTCVALLMCLGIGMVSPAPAPKAITLKWADFSPENTSRTEAVKWLGTEITKRTGGEIKFEYYWSEALVKSRDIPEALRDGLVNAGVVFPPYYPSKFPLASAGTLLMQAKNLAITPAVVTELLTTYGPVKAEMDKWNLKVLYCSPASAPTTFSNRPIKSLADFKGLKIRALGFNGLVYKPVGATTVNIPLAEMYEALQRGTVDGEQCGLHVWWGYGHQEVAKYWLSDELGQLGATMHCVSNDLWNKLTPQQQKIFDEVSQEAYKRVLAAVQKEEQDIYKEAKKLGVTIHSLSGDEHQRWIKLIGTTVSDAWLHGLPKNEQARGADVLKYFRGLLKKRDILIE